MDQPQWVPYDTKQQAYDRAAELQNAYRARFGGAVASYAVPELINDNWHLPVLPGCEVLFTLEELSRATA
jgi:hypothetical protein